MNNFLKTLPVVAVMLLTTAPSGQAQSSTGSDRSGAIFPKGNRAPAANFTGTVWVRPLVPDDSLYTTTVANVVFEAGARTYWHSHPSGQVLLVTDGTGLYQERGKPVQRLHQGDVIRCQPNVTHWHGASPGQRMTHIAINPNTEKGIVDWKEAVTEEAYKQTPN